MSVYVDPLMGNLQNGEWQANPTCHLFADSVEELHEFARVIGLRRDWFHDAHCFPHYELTNAKRTEALHRGAESVGHRDMVKFMRRQFARAERLAAGTA